MNLISSIVIDHITFFQIISNTFKYNMIFSIILEVFNGYDDECLLQLLVDDIDSSPLDVDDDDEGMEEDPLNPSKALYNV